ncbi:hypothetical protein TorRG33x02_173130 [Trema orientale]|uniref:Uncharacterized protein n=1 Tax=Trema orientale TaxID=63057 RepID=A0A2P5EN42_TREOI|nr:hypothetical protein TorRG33x02_173130 [Trema orientale]
MQLQHRERTSRTIGFVPKLDLRIWVCTKDVATEWGQDFKISRHWEAQAVKMEVKS